MTDEIKDLQREVECARAAADENPSRRNADALAKAQENLSEAEDRLSDQHFKNTKAVAEYLKNEGYDISQSTVYEDAKAGGPLRKGKDGRYSLTAVKRYLTTRDIPRLDGSRPSDKDAQSRAQEQHEMDMRLKRAREGILQAKGKQMNGQWMLVTDHEESAAAKAQIFKRDLQNLAFGYAERLVDECRGDRSRAPHLAEMLWEEIQKTLDAYARDDFTEVEMTG